MKSVGYARVSTGEQDLSLQIDALRAVGCSAVYEDKISGARDERPGLALALSSLQAGDVLIVWRIDRLGRSLSHLVTTVAGLREKGIGFRSLNDGMIDTTTASGELVFHLFSALAQFERRLIEERTRAGLAAARSRGRLGGRSKIRPDDPRVAAVKQMSEKMMNIDRICEALRISRSTYYRYRSLT